MASILRFLPHRGQWASTQPRKTPTINFRLHTGHRYSTGRVIVGVAVLTILAGAATLRVIQKGPDLIRVEAWGPGSEVAIATAPSMLGERDDTTGFRTGVDVLDDALRRNPGLRVPRTGRVMESLVPAILEQKVITLQAHASWRRLVLRFGTPAPGPTPRPMRVVPSASGWRATASASSWTRSCCR